MTPSFVLGIGQAKKLLSGKTLAVDATLIEANAAMKSIVRRDNGDDWKAYLTKLAKESGLEHPTDEDLRRFDQQRPDKKVSNAEWQSPSDPDSRIAKMKDGRTHLAYKVEHAVDLESDLIVAATVHTADQGDAQTLGETLVAAQVHVMRAGSEAEIREVAADKGYHRAETLAECTEWNIRTYIPEPRRRKRKWTDKAAQLKAAVVGNRRRMQGARGKRLGRLRSEFVERSFAHVCETGGARRSFLRGLTKVAKRYLMHVAARNLGVIMRALFGIGTPRSLQTGLGACVLLTLSVLTNVSAHAQRALTCWRPHIRATLHGATPLARRRAA